MADFGTTSGEYTADKMLYSGMIGKIARILVESEDVRSMFDVFRKEDVKYGKDLEVALFKSATAQDWNGKECTPADYPNADVLLFKEVLRKVFSTIIDESQIDEVSNGGADAERVAAAIVETLYDGKTQFVNDSIMNALISATAGVPQSMEERASAGTKTDIVNGGSFTEVSDRSTAEALLLAIQNAADEVRTGARSSNPYKNKKSAERVVLIAPARTLRKIDTYLRMNAFDNDYSRYGVDDIVTYDSGEYETAGGAVFVVDDRYIQYIVHKQNYREHMAACRDNVDAYLHFWAMFALCPLFGAVKLSETAAA